MADEDWQVVGLDVEMRALRTARDRFGQRGWNYLRARGEEIPLSDGCVDGVVCNVALPYMHIPHALAELHRVLLPGGWLKASLHPPSFTWRELGRSVTKPKNTLFRVFVVMNGMLLHSLGRVISVNRIAESCQTQRGMRLALRRAGFNRINFRREGRRLFVEALRD
jgi:ubiquinone/menaquinone biosynthesis C-methylase UbiE